ncbi:hypothetical protein D3C71_1976850 [compost metagenome]
MVDVEGPFFFQRITQQDGFYILGQIGFDGWLPFGIGHLYQVTNGGGVQSVVRELVHQPGSRFADLCAVGIGSLHTQPNSFESITRNPHLLLVGLVFLI